MQEIKLRTEAWYKDQSYNIQFPESWEVRVLGDQRMPALAPERIKQIICHPVGSPPLDAIAQPGSRVAIIIDDLTRPTPVQLPIKLVVEVLEQAGVPVESITIVIGSGSHLPPSENDLEIKLGTDILSRLKVISHDCFDNLVDLGKTSRGTPLFINKDVMESDLRIGIGCIYPHPAAGFSGGSKIIAPATAGAETIRYMHDHLRTADRRAGSMDTEFRHEIEDIADRIGLDYVINVVLNQEREIAGLFCGDKLLAHRNGIEFAIKHYSVSPIDDADIVVADMYPFDIDLQFAYDRGFWPLLRARSDATKVILAACPNGLGSHKLYPISMSLFQRYTQRLKKLHWRDLRAPVDRVKKMRRLYRQKSLDYMMVSTGVGEKELKSVFPNARLYRSWDNLLRDLVQHNKTNSTKVAVYRCAPFLIPAAD